MGKIYNETETNKMEKITKSVKLFQIFYGCFQLEPFHINLL